MPHTDRQIDRLFVTLKTGLHVKWNLKIISIMTLNLQDVTALFCLISS